MFLVAYSETIKKSNSKKGYIDHLIVRSRDQLKIDLAYF